MKHIYFLSLLGLFSTVIKPSQKSENLDFHALRLLVELNMATSEERAQYLSHKAAMGLLGKNKRTTRRSEIKAYLHENHKMKKIINKKESK